eukprot:8444618-Pyramimonas_sp.AAC.3
MTGPVIIRDDGAELFFPPSAVERHQIDDQYRIENAETLNQGEGRLGSLGRGKRQSKGGRDERSPLHRLGHFSLLYVLGGFQQQQGKGVPSTTTVPLSL